MTCRAANHRHHCGERVASVSRKAGAVSQTEGGCCPSPSRLESGGRAEAVVVCCRGPASGLGCPCQPRPRLPSDPWVPGPAVRPTRAPSASVRCWPGPHCGPTAATMSLHGKRKEIYKYEAPWTVYAMNWSVRPDKRFRLALGSFVEEYNNKVGRAGARNPVDGERAPGAPFPGWSPDPRTLLRTWLSATERFLWVWSWAVGFALSVNPGTVPV